MSNVGSLKRLEFRYALNRVWGNAPSVITHY